VISMFFNGTSFVYPYYFTTRIAQKSPTNVV
jgi:hypothetical protein